MEQQSQSIVDVPRFFIDDRKGLMLFNQDKLFKKPGNLNIHVQGNIGAGKTYLLKVLSSGKLQPYIDVIPEPLEKWIDFNNVNLLELMAKDPNQYSATFQRIAMVTLYENHIKANTIATNNDKPIKIMERSIDACLMFSQIKYAMGHINSIEYAELLSMYNIFKNDSRTRPDIVIYIQTSVGNCVHNINVRSNYTENHSIGYLTKLEDAHKISLQENIDNKIPVSLNNHHQIRP